MVFIYSVFGPNDLENDIVLLLYDKLQNDFRCFDINQLSQKNLQDVWITGLVFNIEYGKITLKINTGFGLYN